MAVGSTFFMRDPYGIFQDAFTHVEDTDIFSVATATIKQLVDLAGTHETDDGRKKLAAWRRRTIMLIPEAERSKSKQLPATTAEERALKSNLTREERLELLKEDTIEQMTEMPVGSLLLFVDGGGADGNGRGAAGWAVCVTTKSGDWEYLGPTTDDIIDELWGLVVMDPTSLYWLGAHHGTDNTAELNSAGQRL